MIEITHKQAQHLIRQGMDRRLPDEQWAALQAHLERCPDCTAYRQRLTGAERRLNHALHLRWGSARGPVEPIAERLLRRKRMRAKLRRLWGKASWGVLALLLLIVFIAYRRLTTPEPPPRQAAAPRPTQVQSTQPPVADAIAFRGLAVFETRKDGNDEIYLLNASGGRADLTNLTQNSASDTAPAWSPDGEWIAFLSDRGGKTELYALTVAGSRLTQLTSAPGVEWQGPLEWSADGQWIALTGQRGGAGGASFLYLVPVNGADPRSIANTRGAQPWVRFSSAGPLLAYTPGGSAGGLLAVNIESGTPNWLAGEDTFTLGYRVANGGAFDWTLGGRGLVYVADGEGEEGSLLRLSPEMDGQGGFSGGWDTIDRLPGAGAFRAVSWIPNSLQVAALQDADGDGCATLRINHAYNRQVAPRDIPGLCVLGGLERANWTPDGNWLLLAAREQGEETEAASAPGIFALRVQNEDNVAKGKDDPLFERLVDIDLPNEVPADAGAPTGLALRVKPSGRSLGISPQPAAALGRAGAEPRPTLLPPAGGAEGLPEWVYFTVRRESSRQVFRSRADGSLPEPLTPEDRDASCPRLSPDGTQLAYVMQGENEVNEIYVADAAGKDPRLLEYRDAFEPQASASPDRAPFSLYHCPSWSPDGKLLAFEFVHPSALYLAILPADGTTPATFVPIENYSDAAPLWLPGEAGGPPHRLMLVYPQSTQPARLMQLDLDLLPKGQRIIKDPGKALTARLVLTGWHDAWSLALSPDGKQFAALMIYYNASNNDASPTFGQLRVYDTADLMTLGVVPLNHIEPTTAGKGTLGWIDNGTVGMVRTVSLIGPGKALFERFDWRTNDLDTIAETEDIVYSTAWNEQGWVIFADESGLWAMQVDQENPIPAQLNGENVTEVQWK